MFSACDTLALTINWQPIIGVMLLCFGVGLALIRGGQWFMRRKPAEPAVPTINRTAKELAAEVVAMGAQCAAQAAEITRLRNALTSLAEGVADISVPTKSGWAARAVSADEYDSLYPQEFAKKTAAARARRTTTKAKRKPVGK